MSPFVKTFWVIVSVVVILVFVVIPYLERVQPKRDSVLTETIRTSPRLALPHACDSSTDVLRRPMYVNGTKINVRTGPGSSFDRIINQKASRALNETLYITIDDSVRVVEECSKEGWSWIRVISPDHLTESHRGWVSSQFLDDGKNDTDPYQRLIPISALSPYTASGYPETTSRFASRLSEIQSYRRRAAELAIDSGVCKSVSLSELSLSKSNLNHLHFWVDCDVLGKRFTTDEFELDRKKPSH